MHGGYLVGSREQRFNVIAAQTASRTDYEGVCAELQGQMCLMSYNCKDFGMNTTSIIATEDFHRKRR